MEVPLAAALGHVIRELRQSHGMSLTAFAADADVSRTYVQGVEEGRRNPPLGILVVLSQSLGVRVSDLLAAAEQRDEG